MSIRTGARVNVDAAAWGKVYASKNGGQQFSGTVVTRKSNGDFLVEFDDGRFSCAEEYVHAVCEDDVMADEDVDEDEDVVMREDDDDDDDENVAAMKGVVMNDEDPGNADEEVVEEEEEPATRKRPSTGLRSARENPELKRLTKLKDVFVAKHVAARTNKGAGLCGNQISGAPRHRRDNITHWLISAQALPTKEELRSCRTPSTSVMLGHSLAHKRREKKRGCRPQPRRA